MKILIDTHILLWALSDPDKLRAKEREELERASNIIYVSAMSIAEIEIKKSIEKISLDFDLLEAVEASGFTWLDFSAYDAITLGQLPLHHKDPFDRMLISQAKNNKLKIMSHDGKFKLYNECKLI